jgi:hypothetical protein
VEYIPPLVNIQRIGISISANSHHGVLVDLMVLVMAQAVMEMA